MADRVAHYGPAARSRLAPAFDRARVSYPPERFVIAAFKLEGEMHLLAAGPGQALAFIKSYPILAASGDLGPKLRQGDGQVPEGIYGIESLNPNSRFHLALRVNYPNAADLERAARDGRTQLGSDIMIHGDAVSRGCLAMGDPAAEELFVLAAETGLHEAAILISPVDFRRRKLPPDFAPPVSWGGDLYAQLEAKVMGLPVAVSARHHPDRKLAPAPQSPVSRGQTGYPWQPRPGQVGSRPQGLPGGPGGAGTAVPRNR